MADSSAAQECENPSETEIEETNKSAKAVKLLREVTQLLLDENDLSQQDKKSDNRHLIEHQKEVIRFFIVGRLDILVHKCYLVKLGLPVF